MVVPFCPFIWCFKDQNGYKRFVKILKRAIIRAYWFLKLWKWITPGYFIFSFLFFRTNDAEISFYRNAYVSATVMVIYVTDLDRAFNRGMLAAPCKAFKVFTGNIVQVFCLKAFFCMMHIVYMIFDQAFSQSCFCLHSCYWYLFHITIFTFQIISGTGNSSRMPDFFPQKIYSGAYWLAIACDECVVRLEDFAQKFSQYFVKDLPNVGSGQSDSEKEFPAPYNMFRQNWNCLRQTNLYHLVLNVG